MLQEEPTLLDRALCPPLAAKRGARSLEQRLVHSAHAAVCAGTRGLLLLFFDVGHQGFGG